MRERCPLAFLVIISVVFAAFWTNGARAALTEEEVEQLNDVDPSNLGGPLLSKREAFRTYFFLLQTHPGYRSRMHFV